MYRNYDLKRKCLREFGIKATKIDIRRKTARRWKNFTRLQYPKRVNVGS